MFLSQMASCGCGPDEGSGLGCDDWGWGGWERWAPRWVPCALGRQVGRYLGGSELFGSHISHRQARLRSPSRGKPQQEPGDIDKTDLRSEGGSGQSGSQGQEGLEGREEVRREEGRLE